MKFLTRYLLLAVILLTAAVPQQAFAYSYGDPNQETIAEAMKEMIAKLPSGAPDWAAVGEIYKVHRPEIESHFGASVAATLDADIKAQDRERFLSNYKALLVLNLERRFDYANKDVTDYSQSKLLLAKAKGTYDVLQPYVADDATDAAVRTAFDEALAALGNPGLFGVGEEPVDPERFQAKTDFILSKMKPLFKLQTAPAAAEPAKTEPAKTEPAKSEPAKTEPGKAEPAKSEPPKAVEPEKPEEAAADPAKAPAEEAPAAEAPAAEAPDAQAGDAESAAAAETDAASPAEATDAATSAPATATEAEPVAAVAGETAETTAHAPMERQDRTNPIVSIVVIGAVALAAAGGIAYAKKRKLF